MTTPATPPAAKGGAPLLDALKLFQNTDLSVFMVASFVISGLMQFYFLGSAQFMIDRGISPKAVPATMAIAQVAQAGFTIVVLGTALGSLKWAGLLGQWGFKTILVLGGASWVVLYMVYIVGRPKALLVVSRVTLLPCFIFPFLRISSTVKPESAPSTAILPTRACGPTLTVYTALT